MSFTTVETSSECTLKLLPLLSTDLPPSELKLLHQQVLPPSECYKVLNFNSDVETQKAMIMTFLRETKVEKLIRTHHAMMRDCLF